MEVSRVRKAARRWQGKFLEKVFTPGELRYARTKKFPYQHLAARLAAKEAVLKALSSFYPAGAYGFPDIEIANAPGGRPVVSLRKKSKTGQRLESGNFVLSMAHTKDWAVASVLVWTDERGGGKRRQ